MKIFYSQSDSYAWPRDTLSSSDIMPGVNDPWLLNIYNLCCWDRLTWHGLYFSRSWTLGHEISTLQKFEPRRNENI